MNKALLLSKRADGGCSVYCFQEVAVYGRAADRFDSLKLTRTGYIQSLSKKERSLKNQINRYNKREERYIVVAEITTLAFSRFVLRHFPFSELTDNKWNATVLSNREMLVSKLTLIPKDDQIDHESYLSLANQVRYIYGPVDPA